MIGKEQMQSWCGDKPPFDAPFRIELDSG